MTLTYKVVILHEQDGRYSAIVPAMDVASWGHTVSEALKMVGEALHCHLASMREDGEPIPADPEAFTFELGDAIDAVVRRVTVEEEEAVPVA